MLSIALGSLALGCAPLAGDFGPALYSDPADADAELQAFAQNNSSCQLWTNWQKMCSRTGQNGAVACTIDPAKPVEPSKPFCVADADGYGGFEEKTNTVTQRSRDRFCTSFQSDSALSQELGRAICFDLDKERPFSGFRISSRGHPWCQAWSDSLTFKATLTRSEHQSAAGYYCAKRSIPDWCAESAGFGTIPAGSPDHPDYDPARIVVPESYSPEMNMRVVGVFCKVRADGK